MPTDKAPLARQIPELYTDLRSLAERMLRGERADLTWQPTTLVHEAYLRLARQGGRLELDRADLLAAAAGAMRFALVDHARRRHAQKRPTPGKRIELHEELALAEDRALEVLAVDLALEQLQTVDPELARLVELRFFGGLSEEETARALGVSARTVRRSWRVARMWLAEELDDA